MVQRNHRAEALKRFATQIPEWASWGGRTNAYAIEWDSTTRTSAAFYSATFGAMTPDSAYVLWVKPTATLGVSANPLGLFSWYSPLIGGDQFSLNIEYGATGNVLQMRDGPTGNAIGSATVIGTAWTHVHIIFGASTLDIAVNGTYVVQTGTPPTLLTDAELVLGRTNSLGIDRHLKDCIVDEIVIFDSTPSISDTYNSGVPPTYTPSSGGLVATYEVEKDRGAINASYLFPTITATGASPPTFSWGGTSSDRPSVTTSALRSVSTNPFRERVSRLSAWVSGTAVTGSASYAVSGTDISSEAPGLMAMPAGGGYSTLGYTGAFVGNEEKPHVTPRLAVSGSGIGTDDSTTYAAVGGTSSLGGVVDARERRLFLPRFVKR